jgi:hypothetical protein
MQQTPRELTARPPRRPHVADVSIALEHDLTAYCIKAMGNCPWPFFLGHAKQF